MAIFRVTRLCSCSHLVAALRPVDDRGQPMKSPRWIATFVAVSCACLVAGCTSSGKGTHDGSGSPGARGGGKLTLSSLPPTDMLPNSILGAVQITGSAE